MTFWIVIGVIVLIGLWAISVYNGLVGGRNQAQTAWSQIDVQLKRRHDLIPNLVQVVKDAMGYEQETLTKVVQARNNAVCLPMRGRSRGREIERLAHPPRRQSRAARVPARPRRCPRRQSR